MKQIPIIHLHIPKAAGTTITTMFLSQFPREEVFQCGDNEFGLNHYQSNLFFINLSDEEKARYRFIAGHVEFAVIQGYPAKHFSFTFLRNPISRINSMYHYIRQNTFHHLHPAIIENNLSMEGFCTAGLWHEIDNGMCRRISGIADSIPYGKCTDDVLQLAKYNLENNISFFGLQERFNESLFLLMYYLDAMELLNYRKSNITKVKKRDRDMSESERTAIESCNHLDLKLYAFARELYAERNREAKTVLAKPMTNYLNAMKIKASQ